MSSSSLLRSLFSLLHRIVSLATLRVQSDLCLNESIFTLVDKLRESTNLSVFFFLLNLSTESFPFLFYVLKLFFMLSTKSVLVMLSTKFFLATKLFFFHLLNSFLLCYLPNLFFRCYLLNLFFNITC